MGINDLDGYGTSYDAVGNYKFFVGEEDLPIIPLNPIQGDNAKVDKAAQDFIVGQMGETAFEDTWYQDLAYYESNQESEGWFMPTYNNMVYIRLAYLDGKITENDININGNYWVAHTDNQDLGGGVTRNQGGNYVISESQSFSYKWAKGHANIRPVRVVTIETSPGVPGEENSWVTLENLTTFTPSTSNILDYPTGTDRSIEKIKKK